jgi:hypothetical protein
VVHAQCSRCKAYKPETAAYFRPQRDRRTDPPRVYLCSHCWPCDAIAAGEREDRLRTTNPALRAKRAAAQRRRDRPKREAAAERRREREYWRRWFVDKLARFAARGWSMHAIARATGLSGRRLAVLASGAHAPYLSTAARYAPALIALEESPCQPPDTRKHARSACARTATGPSPTPAPAPSPRSGRASSAPCARRPSPTTASAPAPTASAAGCSSRRRAA